MADQYFVQNTTGRYEEVDKYIFDNWKYVENEKGERRYTGRSFASVSGNVSINFVATTTELGLICRMLGVKVPEGAFSPHARALGDSKPNLLIVKKGNSIVHYDPATGNQYKLLKKAA